MLLLHCTLAKNRKISKSTEGGYPEQDSSHRQNGEGVLRVTVSSVYSGFFLLCSALRPISATSSPNTLWLVYTERARDRSIDCQLFINYRVYWQCHLLMAGDDANWGTTYTC